MERERNALQKANAALQKEQAAGKLAADSERANHAKALADALVDVERWKRKAEKAAKKAARECDKCPAKEKQVFY
jgi:hypothetical protein